MKRIIDISLSISNNTLIWPGDPEVSIKKTKNISDDGFAVSEIHVGSHCATHIDAPSHFIENGKSIDLLDLSIFIGTCLVIDFCTLNRPITSTDIEKKLLELNTSVPERLILKTRVNSSKEFFNTTNQLGINKDAAVFLVSNGCKLVCIDLPSIEPSTSDMEVHKHLLKSETIIMESVNLTNVDQGHYTLVSLPLKLYDTDASPCRAILVPSSYY